MRGRTPRPLEIVPTDVALLQEIVRSRARPWFQVQRARIVLAVATGQRIQNVAAQLHCDPATVWRVCRRYEAVGLELLLVEQPRSGHPQQISPPLQQAQIVELACLEPIAKGLHLTHWTSQDLARQAVADRIVDAISACSVRRILAAVDLQPHRTRYWKTAHLDDQFKERAEQVLWCYANAVQLARRGVWVVCVDEMPSLQVLERTPIRLAIPGSIEQQEFEYVRHGTVNLLLFLVVHTGRMEAACIETKSAAHYVEQLRAFRRRHHGLKGVFLIQAGDPTTRPG